MEIVIEPSMSVPEISILKICPCVIECSALCAWNCDPDCGDYCEAYRCLLDW